MNRRQAFTICRFCSLTQLTPEWRCRHQVAETWSQGAFEHALAAFCNPAPNLGDKLPSVVGPRGRRRFGPSFRFQPGSLRETGPTRHGKLPNEGGPDESWRGRKSSYKTKSSGANRNQTVADLILGQNHIGYCRRIEDQVKTTKHRNTDVRNPQPGPH